MKTIILEKDRQGIIKLKASNNVLSRLSTMCTIVLERSKTESGAEFYKIVGKELAEGGA